jgi:hypothetical protein
MALAKTARTEGRSRLEPGRTAAANSNLDAATRRRVQVVCDFINAEVGRWRARIIAIGAACLIGMVLFPVVTRIADVRVALVMVAGIFGFWFVRARREVASSYSQIATKRLVAAISKSLAYKPVSSLTRDQFVSLDLFADAGKRWRSRHEIRGQAGQATFAMYEVTASGAEGNAAGFHGVILRLDFPESFPGHVIVLPEAQNGGVDSSARLAKRDLVFVNNSAFDRMFNAYATNYMEAKRVLTAAFLEYIVSVATTLGPDMRLAFVRRSLFVALPHATLLPPISLLSAPVTPEEAAGQIVRLTALADGLARVTALH